MSDNFVKVEEIYCNQYLGDIKSFNEEIILLDAHFAILLKLETIELEDPAKRVKYIGFRDYGSYSNILHAPHITETDGNTIYLNPEYFSMHVKKQDEINRFKIKDDDIDMVILFADYYYAPGIHHDEEVFGFVVI